MEDGKGEALAMEDNEISKSHSHDYQHQDQDLCSPLSSFPTSRKLLRRRKPLEESSLPASAGLGLTTDAAHPVKKKKLKRKKPAAAISLQTTTDGDGSEGVGQILLALRSYEPTTKPASPKNNPAIPPPPDQPAALHTTPPPEIHSLPHPSPSKSRASGAELPATDAGSQTNNRSFSLSELLALFDSASSVHNAAVDLSTSTLANVYGHVLKPELEATARTILDKHGDIMASTGLKGSLLRSQLLDDVCLVYTTLKNSTFVNLTLEDLVSMQTDVKDIQKMNVDVGWLIERLDDIIDARKACEDSLSLLKPNMKQMADLENELRIKEAALQEIQDKIQDIKAKLANERDELETSQLVLEAKTKVKQFCHKSLVDGI